MESPIRTKELRDMTPEIPVAQTSLKSDRLSFEAVLGILSSFSRKPMNTKVGMKPPIFTKVEEPLEVDAWVRAIEAKFFAFTLTCSEERKANFATLQRRSEALMWWEHFKSMQPVGHKVTWVEFKQDFKDHHIPKGLMDRKMRVVGSQGGS
jgi:hypothetical protein